MLAALSSRIPKRSRLPSILSGVGVIAALYAAFFAGLGRNPLLDPDEPIYGQFIKEMVRGGDWLTPHYNGALWFDKPPLFYWLSCACVKLVGFGEYAIRMPSAIFAALTVVMVYLLAVRDFGKRAGLIASAVVGTTLLQIIMSHAAATDSVMVFFMVASLYAYRRWVEIDGRGRLGWMAVCGVAAGFGMLTKGPVVPLLLSMTFLIHLIWTKQPRRLISFDLPVWLVTMLAIGLPWYVAMYVMHREPFMEQWVMANNITRFVKPLHESHTGQWYSYFRNIPMVVLFFFPWTVFLPQAIARHGRSNAGAKLAFCWAAVVFVFFSISKTQNFTYMLPAFPALAVLVGALFGEREKLDRPIRTGLWVGVVFSLVMAAGVLVMARKQTIPGVIPIAIVLALVFAIPAVWALTRRSRLAPVPWMIAAGMLAFNLMAVNVVLPGYAVNKSSKDVARYIRRSPEVTVAAFGLWRPGLFFYLDRKPIDIRLPEDLARLAAASKPALVVCKQKQRAQVGPYCADEVYASGDLVVYANKAYLARR